MTKVISSLRTHHEYTLLGISFGGRAFASVYLLLSCLCFYLYSYSFEVSWFYDDAPTFRGLDSVNSLGSAWAYIWSGSAGPLGRPISNVSFLANFNDWPNNPKGFRVVSTIIHIFNSTFLALLVYKVSPYVPALKRYRVEFSILVASVWMLNPIHFTAILMPVQRMTLLSGGFVLIALYCLVHGRELDAKGQWRRGLIVSTLGMLFWGGLGLLSKENAALLPLFAAVLDFTILKNLKSSAPIWVLRLWRSAVYLFPLLVFIGFIGSQWSGIVGSYEMRPFTFGERVASQVVILWEYLRVILVPDITSYSPFHDDYKSYSPSSLFVWLAVFAWAIAIALAVFLSIKKASLYLAFTILWFLVAHLLESTVIPLELYFEHRNYLAAIGPIAFCCALAFIHHRFVKFAPLIGLVLVFSLWRVSSLWGDAYQSRVAMIERHPESQRAVMFSAIYNDQNGNVIQAMLDVANGVERIPHSSALRAARLQLSCSFGEEVVQAVSAEFEAAIEQVDASYSVADSFYALFQKIKSGDCNGMGFRDLIRMINGLAKNKAVKQNYTLMHHLFHIKSTVYIELGDNDKALDALLSAHHQSRNPETIILTARLLSLVRGPKEACFFMREEMKKLSKRVLLKPGKWKIDEKELGLLYCGGV